MSWPSYEPLWLKHCLMISNTELYILILVKVTLAFIQLHREARKQNFLFQLPPKVFDQFKGNFICR